MKQNFFISVAAAFLLSGCISYDYQGRKLDTPSETVVICTDETKLDMANYTALGNACASGDSANTSKDDLYEKLSAEAKECGADVILVTAYQIKPVKTVHGEAVNANFDHDETNATWQQIGRDIDNNYGNMRGISCEASANGSYNRIIKAKFLKRNALMKAASEQK